MAKTPETEHRFRIFADVPETTMGQLLATLTKMGLQNIGYELITDVVTFNKRERTKHEESAVDVLTAYAKDHPTFQISDAVKHFLPLGRTKAAIYTAAANLVGKRVLKKLGPKSYALASVKAIAGPKEETTNNKKRRGAVPRYEMPNRDIIANAIGNKRRFAISDIAEVFSQQHRNPKSISPILSMFVHSKNIKVIKPGEYEVLKKIKVSSTVKTKESKSSSEDHHPVLNGPANVVAESSNG